MSCCNQPKATSIQGNVSVVSLKSLDLWAFRGFSGLINLFTKRLVGNPNPLNKTHLDILGKLVDSLEVSCLALDAFPERDLTQEESDDMLLGCLGKLEHMVKGRVSLGFRYKDLETSEILRTEVAKLRALLAGYEAADSRADNPQAQGQRDRAQGWANRGGALYAHDFQVREYDRGYEGAQR